MKKILMTLNLFWISSALAGPTANIKDGVILKGYDAVSYFNAAKPQKGDPQISVEQDGIRYLFINTTNKEEFLKNPAKYKPAFEGWCATAVAKGIKYDIDPESYKITDGRLFLFYKDHSIFGVFGDAKKDWLKDEPSSIKKADANWSKVRESDEEK